MKKIIIIIIAIVIVVSIIGYFVSSNKEDVSYVTALVEKGKIIQTVSETGTVKAANEINLSFLNSGKLAKIETTIGSKIKKDQVLAELDHISLDIKKEEAEASLDIAKEDLNKLLAGATAAEIEVSRANVKQAKASYESAKKELEKINLSVEESIDQAEKNLYDLESDSPSNITAYEQAVIAAETSLTNTKFTYQRAIDNKVETALTVVDNNLSKANTALDVIDRTVSDPDGKYYIGITNKESLDNTNSTHAEALAMLAEATDSLDLAETNSTNQKTLDALDDLADTLDKIFESLQYCYTALENSVTSSSFTQTNLDTLKSNISAEITIITTAISSVETSEQNLNDAILSYNTNVNTAEDSLKKAQVAYDDAVIGAENTLATAKVSGEQQTAVAETKVNTYLESWEVAQAEFNRLTAPANKYDVALAQARVKQAQAAFDSMEKQIDDAIIKAPIDGTVTKIEYKIGEQITSGSPVVGILGENNFEIEILISESDIAKITKDNDAEITLDSFGSDIKFFGTVYFIEPAETEVQEVVYYKVKVNFEPREYSIKSGMTANVIITTAEKNDVLVVPSRAIIEKNGEGKIVRVLVDGKMEERQVNIGLRGDEGKVEILSGLKEGKKVVTSVKDNNK